MLYYENFALCMALFVVVFLGLRLFAGASRRKGVRTTPLSGAEEPTRTQESKAAAPRLVPLAARLPDGVWCAVIALIVHLPLVLSLSSVLGKDSIIPGDAVSHLTVASRIAKEGLSGGFIEAPGTGFPFFYHYPPGPTLVLAGVLFFGVPPVFAQNALACLFVLAASYFFCSLLRACGLRFSVIALCALLPVWVSPYFTNVGLWAAYFGEGRFSQVATLPVLFILARVVLLDSKRGQRWVPFVSALLVAFHANLALVAFFVSAPAALFFGKAARRRFLSAALAGALSAAFLHAAGLANMGLPFGYSELDPLRLLGFSPGRFTDAFFSGELLDARRFPIASSCFFAGLLLGLVHAKERPLRAALACLLTVLLVALLGPLLPGVPLGQKILSVVSPRRVLVLLPWVFAAVLGAALHFEGRVLGEGAGPSTASWGLLKKIVFSGGGGALAWGLPVLVFSLQFSEREEWWARRREHVKTMQMALPVAAVDGWIGRLGPGRLAFDARAFVDAEPAMLGIGIDSGREFINSLGGPGAQTGAISQAVSTADWYAPTGARVAEMLGVRWLLTRKSAFKEISGGKVVEAEGDVVLLSLGDKRREVGLGCVERLWTGKTTDVRRKYYEALRERPDFLSPHQLIEVREKSGRFLESSVQDDCSIEGAAVLSEEHPSGSEVHFRVRNPSPVDAVVRMTYLDSFQVFVDGHPTEYRKVVPGFVSVRLSPGEHSVSASVGLSLAYWVGLCLWMVVAFGLAFSGELLSRGKSLLGAKKADPC